LGLTALFGLVAAPASAAPPAKPATPQTLHELDQRLAETFKSLGVPGASVAIIENGEVALAKGYGVSDVANGTPVTPDTIFRAGSISKSLVGISVMMLVEQGKLDLDAKLADLAPEIPFTNQWESTDPVRLVHLMEHTTGFDDIRFSQYLFDGAHVPLKHATELYGPYVSRWKPGTYVAYSNAPPVIAGYIVEKVSGESWADFTRRHIFEPLGMSSATWERTPEIEGRLSKSYTLDGKTEQPYVDIPGKPAGALNATPTDLAKLALMMIGRGTYEGQTLLKPQSVARIESPMSSLAARLGLANGYGLGNIAIVRERSVFHGHDGGIDGFLALYAYEPVHKAGFVAMINAPQAKALQASDNIISYLERDWVKPAIEEMKPAPGELEKLAGIYQSTAPRQQMLAPIEKLADWSPVSIKNGHLLFTGIERIPVGANIFQRTDRAGPTLAFAPTPGGAILLTSTSASRRVAMTEIVIKSAFGAVYSLALVVTILYLLIWLIGWFGGRLADRGGALVRLVPTLAILSIPTLFAILFVELSDPSFTALRALGTQSPAALAIYALSLAIPILGALSVLSAIIANRETPLFARALAFVNGGVALGLAAWLWQFGWVGLKTWI
jgi:CubicO group peptidase (beta-lactamase class C family)